MKADLEEPNYDVFVRLIADLKGLKIGRDRFLNMDLEPEMCAMEYARLIRERNDPRWQQTTEVHTSCLTYQARPKAHYTAQQTVEQLVFLLHSMATRSRTYGFDDQGGASLRGGKKRDLFGSMHVHRHLL